VSARNTFIRLSVAALLVAASAAAFAQGAANKGQPNALQGFSENRNKPVQIEAASLEVRDKDKKATFTGNVKVVQGDTTMQCRSLIVFYEQQDTPGAMKAAQPGPGGSQQISKLEATGGVKVTQKDQIATGDTAHFDMRANTVTLNGNVTVTQGKNVMKGDRLVVDMTSGVSRVEGKGPVRLLIDQENNNNANAQSGGASGANSGKPGFMQGPKLGPRPFPSN
jgi:lipopolysaccharide export system protein LptA